MDLPVVTIHVGGIHVSATPLKIKTILGSCVSACLFDPDTMIGGMNHFLLPGDVGDPELSTRYGVNAMEVLINEMMKLGANRKRLKAKIFGGADIIRVNHSMMMVGAENIRFVREFLDTEKIPVLKERLGGNEGLIVHFIVRTFDVFVKPVSTDRFVQKEEITFCRRITKELMNRDSINITLF